MMKSNHKLVRTYLRANPDGATVPQICQALGLTDSAARGALNVMPDVFIDRWTRPEKRGKYSAVWCAIAVPENCPHPLKAGDA